MINKDHELTGYVKTGEICDFLEDYKDFVEISAQKIRELLLDPQVNNVRIKGAVISGTLDLRDTLSAEGSPIGGLELISCVILEPLHLERSHLTHLSLLKSAFTELHAQNCRIEGHVDLGYVYSSEEPESRSFKDNPELIRDNHAIDEVFKNIPGFERVKTGLNGPDNWWKYETALEIKSDSVKKSRGRCQVNLSEASIGGSLYLDGCRLVAAAIGGAINLSLASIGGDCYVRGGHVRRAGSIISTTSGSFFGIFSGKNISLLGDFWGCGGIYWGDSNRTVFFQGARIKGGVFFQKTKTDRSNGTDLPKAVIRGELNFLAARIEGWSDLTGLHCLQLIFSTATIGSNFQLRIEDKSETNLLQIIDLRSMKVGGDFLIDIKNYHENSMVHRSQLVINSSEVNGNFTLQGNIDSVVLAENMRVNGLCSITATFIKDLRLNGLNAGTDVEFYPTIYKTADLSGIHVRGSLYLSSDLEKESGGFKSLKLVHQITSEDWRNFADSLSDRDIFLNKCFNEPSCGLILKHAVIGKELRIHRLQTDLGDMDTDFINWRDRFREVYRKPLRFLISVYKKEPSITFSKHLVKWAEIGLDRLYGISSKRIKIAYFSNELSFYPGFYWIRCYVEQIIYDRDAGGLIDCLWHPVEERIVMLGGESKLIHQFNEEKRLKLETKEQVKDYLRFFCECVWEDKGPFHICEEAHELDNSELREFIKQIKDPKIKIRKIKIKKDKNPASTGWFAIAHTIHADRVFKSIFIIDGSGQIERPRNKPTKMVFRPLFQYSKHYRYASYKQLAFQSVRPMALKLEPFGSNSVLPRLDLLKTRLSSLGLSSEIPPPPILKLSDITIFCSDELSFYPGFFWVRIYIEQTFYHAMAGGLIDCLWNKESKEVVILGGKSDPIHKLNRDKKLELKAKGEAETEKRVKDYLCFFCECVWGDEGGAFHIYERAHESDKSEIQKLAQEVIVKEEENGDYWIAEAHVLYAGNIFKATFHVKADGLIDIVDDNPIGESVDNRFQFSIPYRYGINKKSTLNAIRPMRLVLEKISENSPKWSERKLGALRILFSERIDELPKLKKNGFFLWKEFFAKHYIDAFCSHTGGYRRWLDRFGFALIQRLPVIDLRGMHAESLSDRSGSGWRNPESFAPFDSSSWLNFKIFFRLEGFSFNRIIHPLENPSKKEKALDDLKSGWLNRESSRKSPVNLYDQNWKSRVGWLYRQYPRGVPDRKVFHQQPFAQLINAGRSHGDISNLRGILKTKISIEFMLLAQRATPRFLCVFGTIALLVFIGLTHFLLWHSANNNVWPVSRQRKLDKIA